jgi:stress-induced morphogen
MSPTKMQQRLEARLMEALQPTKLEIADNSGGCGQIFHVDIVSAAFDGKQLLARHRLVNSALKEEMKEIHALTIGTFLC